MTFRAKGLAIDLFDTIVDVDHTRIRTEMAMAVGIPPDKFLDAFDATRVERNTGILGSARADMERVLREMGHFEDGLLSDLLGVEGSLYLTEGTLFPDAADFVAAVRTRGVPVAIVSNCARGVSELLRRLLIASLCDSLVLSFEVGSRKPEREIYERVTEELGIEAGRILFIDDNEEFCKGAGGLGMHPLVLCRGHVAQSPPAFAVVNALDQSILEKFFG